LAADGLGAGEAVEGAAVLVGGCVAAASEGDADVLGPGVVMPVAQPATRVIVARPAMS
jgi:hypothetical protein